MIDHGRRRITVNRWLTRRNGVYATYPVALWVEVLDYVHIHVWEYMYTDRGVFKRPWDGRDNQANWEYAKELCCYNRGWGSFTMYMQMRDIIADRKDSGLDERRPANANLQNLQQTH